MKPALMIAGVCLVISPLIGAEPTDRELLALLNSVERRVEAGNADAMNDLTTLPGKMSVPAFLNFFKNNYNIFGATARNRMIGKKAALLATSTPGGEETLTMLLTTKPGDNSDGLSYQQITAIKCLAVANNKVAVRILCRALIYPEFAPRVSSALASMHLPQAPVAAESKTAAANSSIEKWKVWWKTHADDYAGKDAGG